MMALKDKALAEPDNIGASRMWRWVRLFGLSIALVFLIGVVAGFTMAAFKEHGGLGGRDIAVLAGMVLVAAGCGWLLARELRKPTGEEPPTARERMNRNILIGCGLLGFVTAIILIASNNNGIENGLGVFTNDPLPPAVAALLIVVLGVVLPVISYYWHKVIDEQEVDAYKTGALYGLYFYMIASPVWWLAWRGGFVPAPNGFIIYYATITILGIVWIKKKYG